MQIDKIYATSLIEGLEWPQGWGQVGFSICGAELRNLMVQRNVFVIGVRKELNIVCCLL